ncbi:MAG: DNA alkylation repair protein [Bacteroidales bacterium]
MKSNHKCGSIDATNLLYLSGKLDDNLLSGQIRNLKRQLRGVMNGVASASMQERGLNYKVNYGVPFVILKQMTKSIPQNHELAQLLWVENVRELNIAATFVQPIETFTESLAKEWLKRIKNVEQAEHICMNLLQYTPFALPLIVDLLQTSNDAMVRYTAWLLLARISRKVEIEKQQSEIIINQAIKDLAQESYPLSSGALLALKRLGTSNNELANVILNQVSNISFSSVSKKELLIEDLRFEFDYYNQSAL